MRPIAGYEGRSVRLGAKLTQIILREEEITLYTLTKINLMWKKLEDLTAQVAGIASHVLPGTGSATTGQILKLTGANKTPSWEDEYSYTPPAYSSTEFNTGQKWIDGKDIYCKVIQGSLPVIDSTTSYVVGNITGISDIVNIFNYTKTTTGLYSSNRFYTRYLANGDIEINGIVSGFSEGSYSVVIFYTKANPEPANLDNATREETEEPVEELKTTKKKTTKKEETK